VRPKWREKQMHPFFSDVPRETIEKLECYEQLLRHWQKRINLVSANTLDNIWERHFLDSAQIFSFVRSPEAVVVDVGSGAGFPALVLAIMGLKNMHLVESDQKKCAFLREVARQAGVSVTIHAARCESLSFPPVDYYTSRGCGDLEKLINMLWNKMHKNTICLFHKGRNYTKEVGVANRFWRFDVVSHPSRSGGGGTILEISNIEQRDRK
jgi:16S rRNA (guanine527-N7)-methyltransferase